MFGWEWECRVCGAVGGEKDGMWGLWGCGWGEGWNVWVVRESRWGEGWNVWVVRERRGVDEWVRGRVGEWANG